MMVLKHPRCTNRKKLIVTVFYIHKNMLVMIADNVNGMIYMMYAQEQN